MDMSETQIAKLVLGYLKRQNSRSAYIDFLRSSEHLRSYINAKRTKNIVTRFLGLSLDDILKDYVMIYNIVQEGLENTEYFNTRHPSKKLVCQLLYLLENRAPSRGSSMTRLSHSPTPEKDCTTISSDNYSAIIDNTNFEVNATPLNNLPGNASESVGTQTPKKFADRSHRTSNRDSEVSNTENDDAFNQQNSKDNNNADNSVDQIVHQFAQSLLADVELQEKIAENINQVRLHDSQEVRPEEPDDIDSAIKAVLDKTQSDPAFENLIGDIIGSSADSSEITMEKAPASTPVKPSGVAPMYCTEQKSNTDPVQVLTETSLNSESLRPTECRPLTEPVQISTTEEPAAVSHQVTNPPEVIIYDGTLENYVRNDAAGAMVMSQPQPPTVQGLLMMKNNPPTLVSAAGLQTSKPVFLVNAPAQQPIPVSVPSTTQPYYVLNNLLTEQDILTMPTVIVREDKPQRKPAKKKLKTLMPVRHELSEFIKLKQSSGATNETLKTVKPHSIIKVEIFNDDNAPIVEQVAQSEEVDFKEPAPDLPVLIGQQKEIQTPEEPVQVVQPPTPKSATGKSHVRALDFHFHTPPKESAVEVKSTTAVQNSKSSPSKGKSVKSLFGTPIKLKSPTKKQASSNARKLWDADLRIVPSQDPTVTEAKIPPPARHKRRKVGGSANELNKTVDMAEEIEKALASPKKEKKKPATRKTRARSTKSPKKQKKGAEEETKPDVDEESESVEQKDTMFKSENAEEVQGEGAFDQITLINCNAKPRYKKKCNIDNNTKVDVKITRVKEIKSLEILSECTDKLILSPSKMNANKRSLVEVKDSKFVTPEIPNAPTNVPITSAKRNITPILETPVKGDPLCPKTPGLMSPVNINDTPMTKMFKEQLGEMGVADIPTPKFPLTPSFPITPFLEQMDSYPNRATDYSTSSSYYQPSDTEQNKSLEQHILEECKKKPDIEPAAEVAPTEENELDADRMIAEKMKGHASNLVARKNLSLVRKSESSESSSDSEEESDVVTSASETSWEEPAVPVANESPTRYQLRSKTPINTPSETVKETKSTNNFKPKQEKERKTNITSNQGGILKELEEKRKRFIAEVKADSAGTGKAKGSKKTPDGVKKTEVKKAPAPRKKAKSPQKKKQRVAKPRGKTKVLPDSSEDERIIRPLEVVETQMLCSKSSTPVPEISKEPTNSIEAKTSVDESEKAMTCVAGSSKPEAVTTFANILNNSTDGLKKITSEVDVEKTLKGMKEMGFPLVPNKTSKLNDVDVDRKENEVSSEDNDSLDVQVFTEEEHVFHDENWKSTGRDCESKLLMKKVKHRLYDEEQGSIEYVLSVTPFELIFEYKDDQNVTSKKCPITILESVEIKPSEKEDPPRIKNVISKQTTNTRSKRKSVEERISSTKSADSQCGDASHEGTASAKPVETKKNAKLLKNVHNNVDKCITSISPLDALYSDEIKADRNEKSSHNTKNVGKHSSSRSQTNTRFKHKQPEDTKRFQCVNIEQNEKDVHERRRDNRVSVEQSKARNKTVSTNDKSRLNSDDPRNDLGDDLMDYAISLSGTSKRKAEEADSPVAPKKTKTEELLECLDVEDFLSIVHGKGK